MKLRFLFGTILVLMLAVTTWASLDKDVVAGLVDMWHQPWGVATLADAYCGFTTFYVWVFYKETGWLARIAWFVGIMIFGNIAMSIYVLLQMRGLGNGATAKDILLRKNA